MSAPTSNIKTNSLCVCCRCVAWKLPQRKTPPDALLHLERIQKVYAHRVCSKWLFVGVCLLRELGASLKFDVRFTIYSQLLADAKCEWFGFWYTRKISTRLGLVRPRTHNALWVSSPFRADTHFGGCPETETYEICGSVGPRVPINVIRVRGSSLGIGGQRVAIFFPVACRASRFNCSQSCRK